MTDLQQHENSLAQQKHFSSWGMTPFLAIKYHIA